jgi:competence ComEA-like helix-hairpin-helix protein
MRGVCDYNFRFDGEEADNSQMYDGLLVRQGSRARCVACDRVLGDILADCLTKRAEKAFFTPRVTTAGGKLNLNTATEEELRALDCLGPTRAKRIVWLREEMGGFASLEDLKGCYMIGEGLLKKLESLVYVEEQDGQNRSKDEC